MNRAHAWTALLFIGFALAGCERAPTKADYVDDRIAAACAGQSGETFARCRLAIIKKYMNVPLEELEQQIPAPTRPDRMGCA